MRGLIRSLSLLAFITFSCQNNVQEKEKATPGSIMPGAKIYDVTKPETWGGDPAMAATPDNPMDDDAPAINAALKAAAIAIDSIKVAIEIDWDNYRNHVYQQLVYLPAGTYHLEQSIEFPVSMAYPERWGRKERYIWMMGNGEKQTILELKSADEIGILGSDSLPKPIVQVVQYTPEVHQGNDNFQLFVTDLSIINPADQPYAVGLSYGTANLGAVRNVTIKAKGESGHTGFAMIQKNTGPGMIENLTVEGFDHGIEILDPWGEVFTFKDITIRNQNAGGIGISVADKQIGLENLVVEQNQPDVIPVLLHDDRFYNTMHGGFPHFTLINAEITSSVTANKPAIMIDKGHIYLQDIKTSGYGDEIVLDHGTRKAFADGNLKEYVSVHGKTDEQEDNVIFTNNNAPGESLMLPIVHHPDIPVDASEKLREGDYTVFTQNNIDQDKLKVSTSWAIVDPTKGDDDTKLMQAAFNSGAKYIGILNTEPVLISETIVINGGENKNVEYVMGYMSHIHLDSSFSIKSQRPGQSEAVAFRIEQGTSENIIIEGLLVSAAGKREADFLLFQNNSGQSVLFKDLRCIHAPRVYRNGGESKGSKVFFNNVEFVYFGGAQDVMLEFDRQNVWAWQFDIEWLYHNLGHPPLVVNNGGHVLLISQKWGEHQGPFIQTEQGGKTEILSAYFNQARIKKSALKEGAANFIVKDTGSAFSMVGQERVRTSFNEQGVATKPMPHKNKFGIIIHPGNDTTVIEATSLPTYLKFDGFDPFDDTDFDTMNKKNHYRVAGLIRINMEVNRK